MKIIAIGIGQCGCRIADEFYAINRYAKSLFNRGVEILIDAFAVSTDEADLANIRHIPADRRHRIMIGSATTFGPSRKEVGKRSCRSPRDGDPIGCGPTA